jgi:hypothetical protein
VSELVLYNENLERLRSTVAHLDTVDEAKDLADKAAAAQTWARRVRLGQDAVNHAAEVKLRAERRAGELLAATPLHAGGRPGGNHSEASTGLRLTDIGVSKDQSHEWQALAAIPEKDFDRALEESRAEGEVTRNGVIRRSGTVVTMPISDELLAKQQRDTLIQQLDRAIYALESPPSAAVAEAERLLVGGDPGPFTPSRFERVVAYATAFADALRKAGVDG